MGPRWILNGASVGPQWGFSEGGVIWGPNGSGMGPERGEGVIWESLGVIWGLSGASGGFVGLSGASMVPKWGFSEGG